MTIRQWALRNGALCTSGVTAVRCDERRRIGTNDRK